MSGCVGHAMAYDSARGVTVLFDGDSYDGIYHLSGDSWEWNETTGIWTQRSSTGPSPRLGHAMAYDSARYVTVFFGGNDGGLLKGDFDVCRSRDDDAGLRDLKLDEVSSSHGYRVHDVRRGHGSRQH